MDKKKLPSKSPSDTESSTDAIEMFGQPETAATSKEKTKEAGDFVGLNQEQSKGVLAVLKDRESLRKDCISQFSIQGINIPDDSTWPDILGLLRIHLISQFKINEGTLKSFRIDMPNDDTSLPEILGNCDSLYLALSDLEIHGEPEDGDKTDKPFLAKAFDFIAKRREYLYSRGMEALSKSNPDTEIKAAAENVDKKMYEIFEFPYETLGKIAYCLNQGMAFEKQPPANK